MRFSIQVTPWTLLNLMEYYEINWQSKMKSKLNKTIVDAGSYKRASCQQYIIIFRLNLILPF